MMGPMPQHSSEVEPSRPKQPERHQDRSGPETVNGSTRVNVAFPFSKINVQDPSKELGQLAALVADLITALEATTGEQLKELRERSEDLVARLS
jgi:hypothetical protein